VDKASKQRFVPPGPYGDRLGRTTLSSRQTVITAAALDEAVMTTARKAQFMGDYYRYVTECCAGCTPKGLVSAPSRA
jgi:nicotinamidase-related amidase